MRIKELELTNFRSFDDEGMIFKDVAATGIAGILQGIGAIK